MEDGDGLKWFNWLYMQVTQAAEERVAAGAFTDTNWLAELDVQFARLYFGAVCEWLAGRPAPGCWTALLRRRHETVIARIQFALAGINAHINHDLPVAIDATCKVTYTAPSHGSTQHSDYASLNAVFDGLIELAKQKLMVRLLGDPLPEVSHLENTIAAWNVAAARESAWVNAEVLWRLSDAPPLALRYMDVLDGIAAVAGKALLAPVPTARAAEA